MHLLLRLSCCVMLTAVNFLCVILSTACALAFGCQGQVGSPCSSLAYWDGTDIGRPYIVQQSANGSEKVIYLDSLEQRRRRGATSSRNLLWPNGVVVFSIGSEYNYKEREIILNAMREWENKTCIRFKLRTSEYTYVHFYKGPACCSFVGRLGLGCQPVSIARSCLYHATVLHEIGHVVGFWHEQNRPDRDKYVKVLYPNIVPDETRNFHPRKESEVDSLGVTYDFNSIMQYSKSAFAVSPSMITIETREPGIPLGRAAELSDLDVLQTKLLYSCSDTPRRKYIPPPPPPPTLPPAPPTSNARINYSSCYREISTNVTEVLESPGYPLGYSTSLDCAWGITVPSGHYVRLSFRPILLPFSDPCKDYIEVYNGMSESDRLLRKMCGEWVAYAFHSSANSLLVVFHSDSVATLKDKGFSSSITAIDVNECLILNGRCDHYCLNTPGSFKCDCRSGFFLSANGRFCHDVNECGSQNGGCSHTCVNMAGSFRCQCPSNMKLDRDRRTCIPLGHPSTPLLCLIANGNCEHDCSQVGNFPNYTVSCSCHHGYQLDDNEKTCSDVDECADGSVVLSCSPGLCVNTIGSHLCACPTGYQLAHQDKACVDINECNVTSYSRDACEQLCVNSPGSFHCLCQDGYIANGSKCLDIDECANGLHHCDQVCTNGPGSYKCSCEEGFILHPNKVICSDVDECSEDWRGESCDHTCRNTNGSYICGCYHGYKLMENNRSCEDINECELDHGGCDDICTNTNGSYFCECSSNLQLNPDGQTCSTNSFNCVPGTHGCPPTCDDSGCVCSHGYRLSSSKQLCIDIDECALMDSNTNCQHHCSNLIGSYVCNCSKGFQLASDNHSCVLEVCNVNNGGCDQYCFNDIFGSVKCKCHPGYSLGADSRSCLPQATATGQSVCQLPCSYYCDTSSELHLCLCQPGYKIAVDGITCIDIDECLYSNGGCSHVCVNAHSSYNCTCPSGFELNSDQKTCIDVNECNLDVCTHQCNNTPGSYQCTCPKGFSKNSHNKCVARCGGYADIASGITSIHTPNFPRTYPENTECWWFLSVQEGKSVEVILRVDTDYSKGCHGDSVEVLNGWMPDSPLLKKVCGSNIRVRVTSSAHKAAIKFKSDRYRHDYYSGLQASFTSTLPEGTFGCGGFVILRQGEGYYFGSKNFPNFDRPPVDCKWNFLNTGYPNSRVQFKLLHYSPSANCPLDFIVVGHGLTVNNSTSIRKVCNGSGDTTPSLILSQRVFHIWHRVTGMDAFQGFHALVELL